jgi:hypothetical protein
MTGNENSPTGTTLEEHLRLGAGFAATDRPRILWALSALAPHLSGGAGRPGLQAANGWHTF